MADTPHAYLSTCEWVKPRRVFDFHLGDIPLVFGSTVGNERLAEFSFVTWYEHILIARYWKDKAEQSDEKEREEGL